MNNPITPFPRGIKMTFSGNVLYCNVERTAEENFARARKALCILLDMDEEVVFGERPSGGPDSVYFYVEGGKIELYRSFA